MTLSIHPIHMLHVQDDWNWLLRDEANGLTAVVDPSEAKGVQAVLETKGWGLDYIFNTHHHWDHTNGNLGLKKQYGCQIIGAARDAARIKGIDIALEDGAGFGFGAYHFTSFDISGHTIGHVAFYCEAEKVLFCGDTLFAMGCGRMFEGTAAMFHSSLQKIAALPPETVIYPAHEYTIPNGRFARKLEPDNPEINAHIDLAKARRRLGEPSIPTTLARELASNPFLRTHSPTIRKSLDLTADATDIEVFAALRAAKDAF
jgi:hydroxyacylglutathione hydrolase